MRKILSKGLAAPGPAKMFGLGNPGPQALSGPVVVVNGLPEKVRPVRRRAAPATAADRKLRAGTSSMRYHRYRAVIEEAYFQLGSCKIKLVKHHDFTICRP